jgi:hypothetical protein
MQAKATTVGGRTMLVKVETLAENTWLLENLMWTNGGGSDVWLGLYKPAGEDLFKWADGTAINASCFRFWGVQGQSSPHLLGVDTLTFLPGLVVAKYLPHDDPFNFGYHKLWIAWDPTATVRYVCER